MEDNDIKIFREMIQDPTQFDTLLQQLDESEGVHLATLISVAAFETPGNIPSIENAARLLLKIIKKRGFFPKLVDYFLLYPSRSCCWEDIVGGGPGDVKPLLLDPYMIRLICKYGDRSNTEIDDVLVKVYNIIDVMQGRI